MKLLLDANIKRRVTEGIIAAGHDVERVRDWPTWGPDDLILEYGYRTGRVIVTSDNDFGTLNILLGQPSAGIIIIKQLPDDLTLGLLLGALGEYATSLMAGALVRIDEHKIRCRPPQGD